MDLAKKEEEQPITKTGKTKTEYFKEALKMIPTLAWVVTSRVLLFVALGIILNIILLSWFLISRDDLNYVNVIVPVVLAIGMVIVTFLFAKSYGVSSAIEFIWNKKKHVFFDFIAEKTTSFLVKKNLPLTSESTWKWLSERPLAMLDTAPSIIRVIARKFFERIPLADYLSGMVQLKAKLTDNQEDTAVLLSSELQQRVNPSIVQASPMKLFILFGVNIVTFVVLAVFLK